MRCDICPLCSYANDEAYINKYCGLFGEWNNKFQYRDKNGNIIGCYIERVYIKKIIAKIDLCCSNCGNHKQIRYTATNVIDTVNQGWRSYGSCLYCPECSATWHERNKTGLNSKEQTIRVIDNVYLRQREWRRFI